MTEKELAAALESATECWLPTGKVIHVAFTLEERDMLVRALSSRSEIAAPIDLSKLERWDYSTHFYIDNKRGSWVKFADVEAALTNAAPQEAPAGAVQETAKAPAGAAPSAQSAEAGKTTMADALREIVNAHAWLAHVDAKYHDAINHDRHPEEIAVKESEMREGQERMRKALGAGVAALGTASSGGVVSDVDQAFNEAEFGRLKFYRSNIEEAEARCCPEDVGFEEWIGVLTRRLKGAGAWALHWANPRSALTEDEHRRWNDFLGWLSRFNRSTENAAPLAASAGEQTLRRILDRCHHAVGESEHSDDESLPDLIETTIREHRQRVNELESLRSSTAPAAPSSAAEKIDARTAEKLADEIEPQIGSQNYVSLSAWERKFIVKVLRSYALPAVASEASGPSSARLPEAEALTGETPRVDALEKELLALFIPANTASRMMDLARQLERELDQATDHLCQVEGIATMYEKRLGPCEHSPVKCAQCSLGTLSATTGKSEQPCSCPKLCDGRNGISYPSCRGPSWPGCRQVVK